MTGVQTCALPIWLVALWRETLLAKNVLLGNTKWYKSHSQLERFKKQKFESIIFLDTYLRNIYLEACERWYNFDSSKFWSQFTVKKIQVTNWQIEYERNHLISKLKKRDEKKYKELIKKSSKEVRINNIFEVVDWEVENWERIN